MKRTLDSEQNPKAGVDEPLIEIEFGSAKEMTCKCPTCTAGKMNKHHLSFKIKSQKNRGKAFGGGAKFYSSEGFFLCSSASPQVVAPCYSIPGLYVRGSNQSSDNTVLFAPGRKYIDMMVRAIKEFIDREGLTAMTPEEASKHWTALRFGETPPTGDVPPIPAATDSDDSVL